MGKEVSCDRKVFYLDDSGSSVRNSLQGRSIPTCFLQFCSGCSCFLSFFLALKCDRLAVKHSRVLATDLVHSSRYTWEFCVRASLSLWSTMKKRKKKETRQKMPKTSGNGTTLKGISYTRAVADDTVDFFSSSQAIFPPRRRRFPQRSLPSCAV